ncbi:MAG: clostripain-related cysteine peptidase [Myxococcota bacterium]
MSRKPWGTYIYLAGDNSLADAALVDLNEMEEVGSGPGLDVFVQVDRGFGPPMAGTLRLHIEADTDPATVTSPVLANLGQTNAGDPVIVSAFLDEAREKYPATQELVVLWNHGSGFLVPEEMMPNERGFRGRERSRAKKRLKRLFFSTGPETILEAPPEVRGILYDDGSGDCLDNVELARLVADLHEKAGHKLAVLGMDACLMTMIEVAVQIRDHVELLVGSEEEEPGNGWSYKDVLEAQAAGCTADELAAAIVDSYVASYPDTERITQSAIRLDKLDGLVAAVDALAGALLAQDPDVSSFELLKAVRRSPRFYDSLYVDLGALAVHLTEVSGSQPVATACEAILAELANPDGPILAHAAKGPKMAECTGISIYLPMPRLPSDHYGELAFAKITRWGEVLDKVLSGF